VTTATETLARFGASLRFDAIPVALVEKAKDHLLDTIGVACSGLEDARAQTLTALIERWGGIPEAGVVGLRLRLPAPKAAFLNALHARVHVFDDTHEAGPAHPGAAVVAGALASAEASRASGSTLLAALVAGYEASTRVAAALGASHYGAGFHNTGTSSPFGAVAAASRARGLDEAQTIGAFGLAGEAAVGLRQYQQDGSMLDTALNGARGAELGVAAAEMAASGLAGPRDVLNGKYGILRTMAGGSAASLTDGLGERWEFSTTSLKPYASSRFTHGPVAALKGASIDHRQVKLVEILTFRRSIDVSDRPAPRDGREALLSHQAAAAMALLGKEMVPADFETLADDVRALADRVHVRHDPLLDAEYPARWPHRVIVTLASGDRVTLESSGPPRADPAETRAKFRRLVTPVLGSQQADAIIASVALMELMPSLEPVLHLLRPNGKMPA
jgi:2-methylcitrate dehydratase PrpD